LHAIFIHGLRGDALATWKSQTAESDFWLRWFQTDLAHVNIWTVGYDAPATRWTKKTAMAIQDRAGSILARLLAEDQLKGTDLALIGHSMGGLIIKQMLRNSESSSRLHSDIAQFYAHVKKVAFIATPHAGSDQANLMALLSIIVRPSPASDGLLRNSPGLKDLNQWYREWAGVTQISHLILVETKPMKFFGVIVKPDSSDPGLIDRVIPIDADHSSICQPRDRDSDVYVLLKNFLSKPTQKARSNQQLSERAELQEILAGAQRTSEILANQSYTNDVLRRIEKNVGNVPQKLVTLIDGEVEVRLNSIRKSRFFENFDRKSAAKALANDVENGQFSDGSSDIRSRALAWCGRIIADDKDLKDAAHFLDTAKKLHDSPEVLVGNAFLLRLKGEFTAAMNSLARQDNALAKTALFMLVQQENGTENGPQEALSWAKKAGLDFNELDSDGKFLWIYSLLRTKKWTDARRYAITIPASDYDQTPILLFISAISSLILTVPESLREVIQKQIPFELNSFPLAEDEESMSLREDARNLFLRSAKSLSNLDLIEAENVSLDFFLWLTLRDQRNFSEGMRILRNSLSDPRHSLRRINFASKFGVPLDVVEIEREIEREDALTAGGSVDAAVARLILALNKTNPEDALQYLRTHKDRLERSVSKEMILSLEIQMLSKIRRFVEAEELIFTLVDKFPAEIIERYRRFVMEARQGSWEIEYRIEEYLNSRKVEDLKVLVNALLTSRNWDRAAEYCAILFIETRMVEDAENVAIALENSTKYEELDEFFLQNKAIVENSDILLSSRSWSAYRAGDIESSKRDLALLQVRRDNSRDRSLEVSIAITSGAWESLAEFVEREWKRKAERTAEELLGCARLAKNIASPRVKELLYAAVETAPDNPGVLMNAYLLATESGLDGSEITSGWLTKAAQHAGPEGPIRAIELDEIIEMQPAWNKRAQEMFETMKVGKMPIFLAAKALNRTLLDLYLSIGILNVRQADPRRRATISAFSGNRSPVKDFGSSISLDTTAVLTLGRTGILQKIEKIFENIFVPHGMLRLLFDEKSKVAFHQPSQIEQANIFRRLIASGDIEVISQTSTPDPDLVLEVGEDLAIMLTEALSKNRGRQVKHYVSIAGPIHRPGSLMKIEADVSGFENILCGSIDIFNSLSHGQLTMKQREDAGAYIRLHETSSHKLVDLQAGDVIFIDDISLRNCLGAGLLDYLKGSGLKVIISHGSIHRIDALLEREQTSQEELLIIEKIKEYIEDGIKTGKIKISPQVIVEKSDDDQVFHHPSMEIMANISESMSLAFDDRYFNKHQNVESNDHVFSIPVLTSLDIVAELHQMEILSDIDMYSFFTSLRRYGYIFVPISLVELKAYLNTAMVRGKIVLETAELKVLREYYLFVRLSQALQIPDEAGWLESSLRIMMDALKDQWIDSINSDVAVARSNWLWNQISALRWASVLPVSVEPENVQNQYTMQIMLLILHGSSIASQKIKTRYLIWLEEDILKIIEEEKPAIYRKVLEFCSDSIIEVASKSGKGGFE
jgi:pimeloyl-ACP methyl ester carboxylesterase